MSQTDSLPLHSTASDDEMETKLAYRSDELSWKNTLLQRYGNLADDDETEEATT